MDDYREEIDKHYGGKKEIIKYRFMAYNKVPMYIYAVLLIVAFGLVLGVKTIPRRPLIMGTLIILGIITILFFTGRIKRVPKTDNDLKKYNEKIRRERQKSLVIYRMLVKHKISEYAQIDNLREKLRGYHSIYLDSLIDIKNIIRAAILSLVVPFVFIIIEYFIGIYVSTAQKENANLDEIVKMIMRNSGVYFQIVVIVMMLGIVLSMIQPILRELLFADLVTVEEFANDLDDVLTYISLEEAKKVLEEEKLGLKEDEQKGIAIEGIVEVDDKKEYKWRNFFSGWTKFIFFGVIFWIIIHALFNFRDCESFSVNK